MKRMDRLRLEQAVRRVLSHGSKTMMVAEGRDITRQRPDKDIGRRDPYTERGITRLKCVRCGSQARHQWQICSDGNFYRPICEQCDALLNALVLGFINHRNAGWLMKRYLRELMS